MIAWVELALGSSVSGAGVGAASGAFTSFMLGRRWIFRAGHRSAVRQAIRYGLVAAGSLGLNSLGQYMALRLIGLPYVMCRVIVAAMVGVCWNFPLHRRFVFAGGQHDAPRARPRPRDHDDDAAVGPGSPGAAAGDLVRLRLRAQGARHRRDAGRLAPVPAAGARGALAGGRRGRAGDPGGGVGRGPGGDPAADARPADRLHRRGGGRAAGAGGGARDRAWGGGGGGAVPGCWT